MGIFDQIKDALDREKDKDPDVMERAREEFDRQSAESSTGESLATAGAATAALEPEVALSGTIGAQMVPPATPAPAPALASVETAPAPQPAAPAPKPKRVYTVKHGDSFWRIAHQQMGDGNRYEELARANGMTSKSVIHPGDELVIPD